MTEFTVLFPFCGLGAGARGFLDATVRLFSREGRFRSLGGIDIDAAACRDFEMLTGSPSLCADVSKMTPKQLKAFVPQSPDVIFTSPPCKGFSGLLGKKQSQTPKYQKLNRLVIDCLSLVLQAWPENPPGLILLENVPRITSRGALLLHQVRQLLGACGYVFHEQTHDCGELGGLAQHRRRFLLVARHKERVRPFLYRPPLRRVRACGEVLGALPMPDDPTGGVMHSIPRISWLNWVRLALIPAGGDWRDLPGVLEQGQQRRQKFARHGVADWQEPTGTVAGTGSNGVANVADPRPTDEEARKLWEQKGIKTPGHTHWFKGKYGVQDWDEPARTVIGGPSNGVGAIADPRLPLDLGIKPDAQRRLNTYNVYDWDEAAKTVTGGTRPGSGGPAVADPRLSLSPNPSRHRNKYAVSSWDQPTNTVIGATRPGSGAMSVADPRTAWRAGVLGVVPWEGPTGVIAGENLPSNGKYSVADPRVKVAFDHGYRVLRFDEPSFTIAGKTSPGCGAYQVADPRFGCHMRGGTYGIIPWEEAAKTVSGHARIDNGAFAIADPRVPNDPPFMIITDIAKPPPHTPIIIAADGTWHRPLTTFELAALQGLPVFDKHGAPLVLCGTSTSAWRERIGNAVPPPTARSIAEQMLVTLLDSAGGMLFHPGCGDIWVRQDEHLTEISQ